MLQQIADHGVDAFYKGEAAQKIVAASKARGGILGMADFASYKAVERAPTECDYRGYHVISAPLPSSGGVVICETLNILSAYPMGELGWHSAQGVHYLTEALRRAYHDRNVNLGDPDFVKTDAAKFISPEYAAQLRSGIAADKATPSVSLGVPGMNHEGTSTTHFSIVDAAGNAASLDLHAERLVRRARQRRKALASCSTTRWTILIEARRAQHVRPGRRREQRNRAG